MKPRNFYRIIVSDNTNQCSLKLPNNFIKDHQKQILLNSVLLMVSDDKTWSMGWMITGDGHIWFQKGWPEFAQHYNLKNGHLLMFTHLGKATFHLKIFDSNCCEINYPKLTKAVKVEENIDEIVPQDDQLNTMEETGVLIASSNFKAWKLCKKQGRWLKNVMPTQK